MSLKGYLVFFAFPFLLNFAEPSGQDRTSLIPAAEKFNTSCNHQYFRIIGRLNYLSNPLEAFDNYSRLESLVVENSNLFLPGSELIQCMREVGNRMIMNGVMSFSKEDADRAYSRALEMGATQEMAYDIRNDVNAGATSMFALGRELVWLSDVIPPAAADGNWYTFLNTGTDARNQARFAINLYSAMMSPQEIALLIDSMNLFKPSIEYHTAIMMEWVYQ